MAPRRHALMSAEAFVPVEYLGIFWTMPTGAVSLPGKTPDTSGCSRTGEMGRSVGVRDEARVPVSEFAARLRNLQILAGQPSISRLSELTGLSRSTIQDKLIGKTAPTIEQTLAIVRACHKYAAETLSESEVDENTWRRAWFEMQRARKNVPSRNPVDSSRETFSPVVDDTRTEHNLPTGLSKREADNNQSLSAAVRNLIVGLRNFETDSAEPYYIGRILIEIVVFLDDYGVEDDRTRNLVAELVDELDDSERRNNGLATPTIAISKRKILALIERLREVARRP